MPDIKSPIQLLIDKNPCAKCRTARLTVCKCAAPSGGGGKGESKDGGGEKSTANLDEKSLKKEGFTEKDISTFVGMINSGKVVLEENYELDKKDHNVALLKLTFQGKPGLTPEELEILNRFLNYIHKRFGEFKDDLRERGISVKDFTVSLDKNSLTLSLHVPQNKYLKEFIEFAQLPFNIEERKERDKAKMIDPSAVFNPNPLPIRPKPKNFKDDDK